MKCLACDEEIITGQWCYRHKLAATQVQRSYAQWVRAFGDLNWLEYLKRILNHVDTGDWAKTVIQVVLEQRLSAF